MRAGVVGASGDAALRIRQLRVVRGGEHEEAGTWGRVLTRGRGDTRGAGWNGWAVQRRGQCRGGVTRAMTLGRRRRPLTLIYIVFPPLSSPTLFRTGFDYYGEIYPFSSPTPDVSSHFGIFDLAGQLRQIMFQT